MTRPAFAFALSAVLCAGCYAEPIGGPATPPLADPDPDEPAVDDDDATDDDDAPDDDDAAPPVDDAEIVRSTLPSTLACGESTTATVTVRNVGTAVWTRASGFKLGAVDDSDPFVGPDPRVWLGDGDSVPPGATWTFTLDMTAPDEAGSYITDWRMVHEAVRWFGQVEAAMVEVECSAQAWVQVACARNGSEICDDEVFGIDPGVTYGVECVGPNGGIGYVATNTGPAQSDGMHRCQGWEDAGQDAWDHLDYVDQLLCDTAGEVLALDLGPWSGGYLWFGSHDHPAGGGHMTNICLVELAP